MKRGRMIRMLSLCIFVVIGAVFLLCSHASAGGTEDIRVLKISPEDGRAVVRTADGKMKVIKVGESIGKQTVVIEIAQERVVLKEQKDNEPETVIIRLETGCNGSRG